MSEKPKIDAYSYEIGYREGGDSERANKMLADLKDPADLGMDNPPEDELSDLSGQLESLTPTVVVWLLVERLNAEARYVDAEYHGTALLMKEAASHLAAYRTLFVEECRVSASRADQIEALQQRVQELELQLEHALEVAAYLKGVEARERALQERVEELEHREQVLRQALKWMDRKGGLGLDIHDRIRAALSAHEEGGDA